MTTVHEAAQRVGQRAGEDMRWRGAPCPDEPSGCGGVSDAYRAGRVAGWRAADADVRADESYHLDLTDAERVALAQACDVAFDDVRELTSGEASLWEKVRAL